MHWLTLEPLHMSQGCFFFFWGREGEWEENRRSFHKNMPVGYIWKSRVNDLLAAPKLFWGKCFVTPNQSRRIALSANMTYQVRIASAGWPVKQKVGRHCFLSYKTHIHTKPHNKIKQVPPEKKGKWMNTGSERKITGFWTQHYLMVTTQRSPAQLSPTQSKGRASNPFQLLLTSPDWPFLIFQLHREMNVLSGEETQSPQLLT